MTANAFEEDVRATKEAGMNAHLSKPIDPEFLFYTLKQWIKKTIVCGFAHLDILD